MEGVPEFLLEVAAAVVPEPAAAALLVLVGGHATRVGRSPPCACQGWV